jgi:uncharacterized protein (DUF2141 family)
MNAAMMCRQTAKLGGAAVVLALQPAAVVAQPPVADCNAAPAVAVTITGLRAPSGLLTIYLWNDDADAFLEHGRSVQRIERAVASAAPVRVCLPAPRPGRYAISVRHDVDGNRRRYDLNDGAGFSRNPPLSLTRPRPALQNILVSIGDHVVPVEVVLNYRFGLTVRPVGDRRDPR